MKVSFDVPSFLIMECPICCEERQEICSNAACIHIVCAQCAARTQRCPFCRTPAAWQAFQAPTKATEITVMDGPLIQVFEGQQALQWLRDRNFNLRFLFREPMCATNE